MRFKNAQVQSEIFMYVIAMVVVGLILLFGYTAVRDFSKSAEQVALIQFEKDLESTFHTISTSYGKVEIKQVEIPGGFDTVCFHDLREISHPGELYFLKDDLNKPIEYPVITDNIRSGTHKNLFLVGGLNIESFYVGEIYVDNTHLAVSQASPGFICFKEKQGRVEFKLVGEGDQVRVKSAE